MNTKEIEARMAWVKGAAPGSWSQTENDCLLLLTEVKRLRGLCGRAASYMSDDCDDRLSMTEIFRRYDALLAELKEASK